MPTGIKTSQLPAASALDGSELVALLQGGISKKSTAGAVAGLAGSGTVTTLTGSVSGHAYCVQPVQSSLYKRAVIVLVNWKDAGQAYTFPTAFANVAQAIVNSFPAASISLTAATLADNHLGTAVNQVIVIEGN